MTSKHRTNLQGERNLPIPLVLFTSYIAAKKSDELIKEFCKELPDILKNINNCKEALGKRTNAVYKLKEGIKHDLKKLELADIVLKELYKEEELCKDKKEKELQMLRSKICCCQESKKVLKSFLLQFSQSKQVLDAIAVESNRYEKAQTLIQSYLTLQALNEKLIEDNFKCAYNAKSIDDENLEVQKLLLKHKYDIMTHEKMLEILLKEHQNLKIINQKLTISLNEVFSQRKQNQLEWMHLKRWAFDTCQRIGCYKESPSSTQDFFKLLNEFPNAKFNKPQRFVFRNGLRIEECSEKKVPKAPQADRLLGKNALKDSNQPMLTFIAYYREKLGDGNKSTDRFRKCNILYYLEDDEIKVYEPWQKNSGLDQGCIVGKGRFSKPEGGYYTVDDLNIGETLVLFGREYKLINCDNFTRKFLVEMGFKVRSPEPEIKDPITEDRNENNVPKSYRKPYVKEYKYQSFLKHHPKTLRFFGYYGDGKQLFEEKREVTLYYDLANGTIRLIQERCKSKWVDGRKDTRVLLRPTKVPKIVEPSLLLGEMGNPTLLNHAHDVQNVLIGGKYFKIQKPTSVLVDSNPLEGRKKVVDYYTDRDLDLGVTLKIFGSDVFLHDCDDFTKNYYHSTYNKELIPVPRPEIKPYQLHKLLYQHEIFGEPEQTVRTNDPFQPLRYMTDLKKFFKNDKYAYDVRELKFLARMISEDPVQKHRTFMIRWFLEDDTMDFRALDLDFENTSSMEHKYFRRMKITKPQPSVGHFERCYYQARDMFLGNIIYARSRAYKLVEADEYTYDYMERNCHIFPHSNVKRIMKTLRQWTKENCGSLKRKFEDKDPENDGCIKYGDFKDVFYDTMAREMRDEYPEQAIKTLARHYADDKYVGLKANDLASSIRTELYRMKYYDFEDLKMTLKINDEEESGYLTPERLYFALRSSSIPLKRDLMKSYIHKFPSNGNKVNYLEFLESINWLRNHTQYEKQDPSAIKINWDHVENEKNLDKIKYNCFLTDMVM